MIQNSPTEWEHKTDGASIVVKIVEDSISNGNRLVTYCWEYPRMIHSEVMTHRVMSRNAASSRAIPAAKLRQRITDNPAAPVHWGQNQAGMQAGAEISDVEAAKSWWLRGRDLMAAHHAEGEKLGLHKQIVNRVIEPWMTIALVVSMTDHANFFFLRNHHAAEPSIQIVAKLAWEAFNNHAPTQVAVGDWHLPYVDEDRGMYHPDFLSKLSAARCARVSYLTHEGTRDVAKDIELHDRLVGQGEDPMHACYDKDTEVLTRRGWVAWPFVSAADELAAVDANESVTFELPVQLQSFPYRGELYTVKGQQLDLAVTPNHKMFVSGRNKYNVWTPWYLEPAETIGKAPRRYLKSGQLVECQRTSWLNPWNIDPICWAKFIGFFAGDGHAPREAANQATFNIRKLRKKQFLRKLGLPLKELPSGAFVIELPGLTSWLRHNCYTPEGHKRLPDGYQTLPVTEVEGLLSGLKNSDGSLRRETWTYYSTSPQLVDGLQTVLHLNGQTGSITTTPKSETRARTFRVNVSNRVTPRVETGQQARSRTYSISTCDYIGTVYCATVSTGALLVRRSGHVVVSGNSPLEHPAVALGSSERCGNFIGWKQYRKTFAKEAGPNTNVLCQHCGMWGNAHATACSEFGKPLQLPPRFA